MSDRETTGKRAFPDPDIDPVEATRMLTEMDQALETFKHLVQGYAEIGPPNSKRVCESFLKHADEDRVGLIAFPADNLPEGVAMSHEVFGDKHKFMLMVSPAFYDGLAAGGETGEMIEHRALVAVRDIVKEIEDVQKKGLPIMGNAEYQHMIAIKRERRN